MLSLALILLQEKKSIFCKIFGKEIRQSHGISHCAGNVTFEISQVIKSVE